jgi:hypothetical protein
MNQKSDSVDESFYLSESNDGLYLAENHAKMIWQGNKDLIVKEVEMKTLVGRSDVFKKFREADQLSMDDFNRNKTYPKNDVLSGVLGSEAGKFGRSDFGTVMQNFMRAERGTWNQVGPMAQTGGLVANVNIAAAPIKIELTNTTMLQMDSRIITTLVKQEIVKALAEFAVSGNGGTGGFNL